MIDKVIAALAVLLVLAGIVWFATSAPCSLWKFSATKDVPARCIHEYVR